MRLQPAFLVCLTLLGSATAQTTTTRISESPTGLVANEASDSCRITRDGGLIVFESKASNLVSGDTNGVSDIFLYDRATSQIVLVSVSSSGTPATADCHFPSISDNGQLVTFHSDTDFTSNDGIVDVWVRDLQLGTTVRVSTSSAGVPGNNNSYDASISGDGKRVAFTSLANNLVPGDSNGVEDVFVRDLASGATLEVTVDPNWIIGNAASWRPCISEDGNVVIFTSLASNLVPGITNGRQDVFVHYLDSDATERISVSSSGAEGNHNADYGDISEDSSLVVFASTASNLVSGDTNGKRDVFLRDLVAGTTTRISLDSAGNQGLNGWSSTPRVSGDGRYVTFLAEATNLVANDTNGVQDVFFRDLLSGTTERVSISSTGSQATGESHIPDLSHEGGFVVFPSDAQDLVSSASGFRDIYSAEILFGGSGCLTYCTAKVNSLGCTPYVGCAGAASTSGPDDFYATSGNVINNKNGLFFWGLAPHSTPFQGGTKCVLAPVKRTPIQDSGGNAFPVNDCSGSYSFHFTQAYMVTKGVGAGATIYGQFWSRDPFFAPPKNTGLTNGVQFTIQP